MKKTISFLLLSLAACTGNVVENKTPEIKIGMRLAEVEQVLGKTDSIGVWELAEDSAGETRMRVVNAYFYSKDTVVFIEHIGDTVFAVDYNFKQEKYNQ